MFLGSYAFDILYLNGESLLKRNLQERREILRQTFVPVPVREESNGRKV